ncbi:MAG: gliding motility lipoprotein GldH [Nonlabens sp.]
MKIYLLLALVLLTACDERIVDTDHISFKQESWNASQAPEFKIQVNDSITAYDLFINLRNNHEYAFNNLWLISKIKLPRGKVITDTLEYRMAAADGSYLGTSRGGGIVENKLWLKEGIKFNEPGEYLLQLRQVMRKNGSAAPLEQLEGVLDVGYSVEKINQDR